MIVLCCAHRPQYHEALRVHTTILVEHHRTKLIPPTRFHRHLVELLFLLLGIPLDVRRGIEPRANIILLTYTIQVLYGVVCVCVDVAKKLSAVPRNLYTGRAAATGLPHRRHRS